MCFINVSNSGFTPCTSALWVPLLWYYLQLVQLYLACNGLATFLFIILTHSTFTLVDTYQKYRTRPFTKEWPNIEAGWRAIETSHKNSRIFKDFKDPYEPGVERVASWDKELHNNHQSHNMPCSTLEVQEGQCLLEHASIQIKTCWTWFMGARKIHLWFYVPLQAVYHDETYKLSAGSVWIKGLLNPLITLHIKQRFEICLN